MPDINGQIIGERKLPRKENSFHHTSRYYKYKYTLFTHICQEENAMDRTCGVVAAAC